MLRVVLQNTKQLFLQNTTVQSLPQTIIKILHNKINKTDQTDLMFFWLWIMNWLYIDYQLDASIIKKKKQSRYRPGVAQRVPGS